jgi:hypothetical protein
MRLSELLPLRLEPEAAVCAQLSLIALPEPQPFVLSLVL